MRTTDYARRTSGRVFCSAACRKHLGSKPRRIQDKTCEICGVNFRPLQRSATARFCSRECHTVWQRRDSVSRPCAFCGGDFTTSPSQAFIKYCSNKCKRNARIINGTGTYRQGVESVIDAQGYVWVYAPDHPNATSKGRVAEHRLVVEERIGRILGSDEQVHHINGIKTDNRPKNLQLLDAATHTGITIADGSARRRAAQARIRALEAELTELRQLAD